MNSLSNKNIAIGTGILCAILIVALAYTSFQTVNLNSKLSDITDIANLKTTYVWLDSNSTSQTHNSYTEWSFTTNYAGYVTVNVLTSTSEKTFIQLIYSTNEVSYDSGKVSIGASGIVSFPVLPSNVTVRVGNDNLIGSETETVTITLHY